MDKNLMRMLMTVGALRFADEPTDEAGTDSTPPEDAPKGDTDEPLGEGGVKALRSERKRAGEAEKRAQAAEARLKELADAEKSELERAQERARELEAKVQQYEGEKTRNDLRSRVLATKNVPSEWADFVTGDSEDEMNAAADRILRNLGVGDGPRMHPTKGTPGGSLEAGREAAKNFRP